MEDFYHKRISAWRSEIVLLFSVIISIGGIYAAKIPADAGRGGAVAVAVSFLILFVHESHSDVAFKILTESLSELDDDLDALEGITNDGVLNRVEKIHTRVDDLTRAFDVCQTLDAAAQKRSNLRLAIASVFGTLVWGFGDWLHPFFHSASS